MSLVAKAHAIADATPASLIVPVAATMPWWREQLHSVAGAAADIGIVVGLAIAIIKLWDGLTKLHLTPKMRGLFYTIMAILAAVGIGVAVAAKRDDSRALGIVSQVPASKGKRRVGDDGGNDGVTDAPEVDGEPAWMAGARALIGTKETTQSGSRTVAEMFASAGSAELKPRHARTVPWCAAYACHVLEIAEIPSPKSLMAKSFLRWGRAISEPVPGCVVVLDRGERGGPFGHVGFYVGETATHILVLGGNQSDSVCVAKFPKSRVTQNGYRMPRGIQRSVTMQTQAINATAASGAGAVAVAAELSAPDIGPKAGSALDTLQTSQTIFQQLAPYLPKAAMVAALIGVTVSVIVMYRRWQDYKSTGE